MSLIRCIIRSPFWLVNFVIGGLGVFYVITMVAVGAWIEIALRRLGASPPGWLLAVLGVATFNLLGVILPIYLSYPLVGWPAILIVPILSMGVVGWIDKWFSSQPAKV